MMNRMMLPDDNTNRTCIVKWITTARFDTYGDTIIINKYYRKGLNIDKSVILDRKHQENDCIFVGGTSY